MFARRTYNFSRYLPLDRGLARWGPVNRAAAHKEVERYYRRRHRADPSRRFIWLVARKNAVAPVCPFMCACLLAGADPT